MRHRSMLPVLCRLFLSVSLVQAFCQYPSPIFPPPKYTESVFADVFQVIQTQLDKIVALPEHNKSSYSIEVTSSTDTLWTSFHTAIEKDSAEPGAEVVNGSSSYRIASITKVFTVLGVLQQVKAGTLNLDTPIQEYVAGLRGRIPWKDISLRSLASQLSGVPRDFDQSDLAAPGGTDPESLGLPLATRYRLPKCGAFANYTPCTASDLLGSLAQMAPVFPPNQQSTYSNLAFELLGLALANVTGSTYEDYIRANILEPIGMDSSTFTPPDKKFAVLPKDQSWYWNVDQGVEKPTGGLFMSSHDMSKFLRYVLTHYNGLGPATNWFQPASFSGGQSSYYGMPWEIFRTDQILKTKRQVTFYSKGGGVPGYFTNILLLPEYDLGITIFTAGKAKLLGQLRDAVTVPLVQAAEKWAQFSLRDRYASAYYAQKSSKSTNSSVIISGSDTDGLSLYSFIANGTDVLPALVKTLGAEFSKPDFEFDLRLVPTLLYRDEEKQKGELWRVLVLSRPPEERGAWTEECTMDHNVLNYDGGPLLEVVFWEGKDGRVKTVEMAAWRLWLDKEEQAEDVGEVQRFRTQGTK